MDWYKAVLLGASVIVVVGLPFMLSKALRRKEKRRVFDILTSTLLIVYMTVTAFLPNFIHGLVAPMRWLVLAMFLLCAANLFGLSYWLFKEPRKTDNMRP